MLLLSASGGILFAQTGQITGRIEDASGAVVAGAALTLKNTETGVGQSVTSNGEGYYTFPLLDAGSYAITVSMPGFKSMMRSGIKLDVAQTGRVDFRLEIGDASQEVTVSSTAPLLQSESSAVGQVIGHSQVVDLPLNGRDFTQLATLTPGATGAAAGGVIPSSNIRINGMRTSKTLFTIDGVSATDQRFDGVIITPPPDAIQEFRVQSNAMSAEYGQGGAAVTIQLKSGTNALHAQVYEFLRNDLFDARNFFALGKAPLRQNQFGGSAGSPIRKNSTFVFADYQGTRIRRGTTFNSLVPSAAMRSGDFSAQTAPIADPVATPRAPFAGNRIPANRFSSPALFLLKFIPLPNAPGGTFIRNGAIVQNVDQSDIKVDHTFSSADSMHVSYSVQEEPTTNPGAFPENGALAIAGRTQQARLGETHMFAANMFNELRLSYMRAGINRTPQGLGTNYTVQAGIAGFDVTSLETPGFPGMAIAGFTGLNGQAATPQTYRSNVYEILDNLSRIRGRHTFKAGVLFRRFTDAATNGGTSRGNFNFTGAYSTNGFADYLLGYPFQGARSFPNNEFGGTFQNQNFYVQDDFKVSSRLTINLGLRYELNSIPGHMHGTASLVDPDTRHVVVSKINPETLGAMQVTQYVYPKFQDIIVTAKQAGLTDNLLKLDKNDFGPRIGMAWEARKNLVLRAAYGMFYGLQQGNRVFSTTNANVPFVANETASLNTTPVPTKTLANYFQTISVANYGLGPLAFFRPDPNMADPYFQQWNVSLQKALANSLVVEAAYVGNKGTKVEFTRPLNVPKPGAGVIQDRRPWTRFSAGNGIDNSGNSIYHALQTKTEVRGWHGLSLLAAYTWSKSIDDQSTDGQQTTVQDADNLRAERGLSDFDVRHRFTASAVYLLPFFASRHDLLGQVLGGWQLSNIVTLQSGFSFTPIISTDPANTGTSRRPNRIAEGSLPSPTIDRWFDVNAFRVPAAFTFGNSSRNILVGPSLHNWDLGVLKNFRLPVGVEGMRLQFRAEFFDLTNTPHFSGPTTNIQTATAGKVLASGEPRELQLALKLQF